MKGNASWEQGEPDNCPAYCFEKVSRLSFYRAENKANPIKSLSLGDFLREYRETKEDRVCKS